MKSYGGASRRDLFERYDRPALQPLPAERFVHGDWLKARVNIDYHVEVDHHYYSVPHALIHAVARGPRLGDHRRDLSARHARLAACAQPRAGPPHHGARAHAEGASRASGVESLAAARAGAPRSAPRPRRWSSRFSRAGRIPSRAIAPVSGFLRLAKQYGPERLNAACAARSLAGARSYRHVDVMLKHGLDRQPLLIDDVETRPAPTCMTTCAGPPTTTTPESPHDD